LIKAGLIKAGFILTALTRDPAVIRAVDDAGVDRIGIDIESLGKHLRQDPNGGSRFSDHNLDDLATVVSNTTRADPFARLNPLHNHSQEEIDRAVALGARVIMLPYFLETREAGSFLEMVGGRARTVLLVETVSAAAKIHEIVALPGSSEIMIGLNDLRRSMGLSHPFEVLTSELISTVAAQTREAGLLFGFGGVGRSNDATLPVSPDLVYAQYARLGATTAWLSRSFYTGIGPAQIPEAVRRVRERLAFWRSQSPGILEGQRAALAHVLRDLKAPGR